jgi:hypothetical protein
MKWKWNEMKWKNLERDFNHLPQIKDDLLNCTTIWHIFLPSSKMQFNSFCFRNPYLFFSHSSWFFFFNHCFPLVCSQIPILICYCLYYLWILPYQPESVSNMENCVTDQGSHKKNHRGYLPIKLTSHANLISLQTKVEHLLSN